METREELKKGAIAENQEKFIWRLTRSKTADQAQEVTDTISHPFAKSGILKPVDQSGENGYVPSNGNQGSIIRKGHTKEKP
eukprot:8542717-Ditylum_brightwellii.AAC.1